MKASGGGWLVVGLIVVAGIYYAAHSDEQGRANSAASYSSSVSDDSDSPSNLRFHDYDCTVDCSGHEAGYKWAEEHRIDDEDGCRGNSQSFIEGCQAYVQEQQTGEAEDREDDIYEE